MELISQGAEAKIFYNRKKIIKHRFKKTYRIKEIDDKLRKFRTRREAKVMEKLPEEIACPRLIHVDDKNMKIEMEFVKGKKVRDILDRNLYIAKEDQVNLLGAALLGGIGANIYEDYNRAIDEIKVLYTKVIKNNKKMFEEYSNIYNLS